MGLGAVNRIELFDFLSNGMKRSNASGLNGAPARSPVGARQLYPEATHSFPKAYLRTGMLTSRAKITIARGSSMALVVATARPLSVNTCGTIEHGYYQNCETEKEGGHEVTNVCRS